MAKTDAMARRKAWLMAEVARDAAARGEPPPSNAHLDLVLAAWKRSRWAPLRVDGGVTALLTAHRDAAKARTLRHARDLDRLGVDAWFVEVGRRHRMRADEVRAAFARHRTRWDDPRPQPPDAALFEEAVAHLAMTDPGEFDRVFGVIMERAA